MKVASWETFVVGNPPPSEGGNYLPAGPYQMTSEGKWLGVPIGQHNWGLRAFCLP